MEEPLGAAVGTGLEAVEARDFLRGDDRDPRLREAVLAVAHEMLRVGGLPEDELVPRTLGGLESGAAYERFVDMIEAQGGTRAALDRIAAHPQRASAVAPRAGYVGAIDAVAIGEAARALTAADGPFAGIRIVARVGTPVRAGEILAEIVGPAPARRRGRAARSRSARPRRRPGRWSIRSCAMRTSPARRRWARERGQQRQPGRARRRHRRGRA